MIATQHVEYIREFSENVVGAHQLRLLEIAKQYEMMQEEQRDNGTQKIKRR